MSYEGPGSMLITECFVPFLPPPLLLHLDYALLIPCLLMYSITFFTIRSSSIRTGFL